MNRRYAWNGGTWGPQAPRKVTAESNWGVPLARDRKAARGFTGKGGSRHLVFDGDLCDIFDDRGPSDDRGSSGP